MGQGGQALRLELLEALRAAEREGGEDRGAGIYAVEGFQFWRVEALRKVAAARFGHRAIDAPRSGVTGPTRFESSLRGMVRDGAVVSVVRFLPRIARQDPASAIDWLAVPTVDPASLAADHRLQLYRLPTLTEARDAWLDRQSRQAMIRRMHDNGGGPAPAGGWESWRLAWIESHHSAPHREAFLRSWRATRGERGERGGAR